MPLYISTVEKIAGTGLIVLLVGALMQVGAYTENFNKQALQQQANVVHASELLAERRVQRRLNANMMQEEYALTLGTRLHAGNDTASRATRVITASVQPRNIQAKSYLVADVTTGTVYAQRGIDTVRPIASITKLITALTASTVIPPNASVPIIANWPIVRSDYKQLKKGARIQAVDTAYPLLMESNNAVAHALALYYGEKAFISKMQEQATTIGMKDTHIADASGISPRNTATARDLLSLAQYIVQQAPFILDVTSSGVVRIPSSDKEYKVSNHNHFSTDPAFIGGKTGYTHAAGQTMLSLFKIPIDGVERTVAIIILDSHRRKKDIQGLYRWYTKYASTQTLQRNTVVTKDDVTSITGSAGL